MFRTERVYELGLEVDMTKRRVYDYALGRFWQVDPLADVAPQESLSPYHYSFNNPILYNDPFGEIGTNPFAGLGEGIARSVRSSIAKLNKKIDRGVKAVKTFASNTVDAIDGFVVETFGQESTTTKASGAGIDVQGENAGIDSKFVPTADPNADNMELDKNVVDAMGAITKSLTAPSPNGDAGEIAKTLASGTTKAVSAVKEGEKVFSETPKVGDQVQGRKTDNGNIERGFTNINDSMRIQRKWESDGQGNYTLIEVDTIPRRDN
ncbi:MAG: RHS repeat-associated core domain-containing protein [Bacteroidota bacterium]